MRRRSLAGKVVGGFTATLVRLGEIFLYCALWRLALEGLIRAINFLAEQTQSQAGQLKFRDNPTMTLLQIIGWFVITIFVFKYR